jgi:hypothetical protein
MVEKPSIQSIVSKTSETIVGEIKKCTNALGGEGMSQADTIVMLHTIGALGRAGAEINEKSGIIFSSKTKKEPKVESEEAAAEPVKRQRLEMKEKIKSPLIIDLNKQIKIPEQPKTFSELLLFKINKDLLPSEQKIFNKEDLLKFAGILNIKKEIRVLPINLNSLMREEAVSCVEQLLRFRRDYSGRGEDSQHEPEKNNIFTSSEILQLEAMRIEVLNKWSGEIGYIWKGNPVDQRDMEAIHGLKRLNVLQDRLKSSKQ